MKQAEEEEGLFIGAAACRRREERAEHRLA